MILCPCNNYIKKELHSMNPNVNEPINPTAPVLSDPTQPVAAQTPALNPNPAISAASPVAPVKGGLNKTLLAIIVVLILIIGSVMGFFALRKDSGPATAKSSNATAQTSNDSIDVKANDVRHRTDIKSLRTHLEAYYSEKVTYPTLANMNDTSWRSTNLPSLDPETIPSGGFVSGPATDSAYSYAPSPSGCNNKSSATECQSYVLSAKLSTGTYSENSL